MILPSKTQASPRLMSPSSIGSNSFLILHNQLSGSCYFDSYHFFVFPWHRNRDVSQHHGIAFCYRDIIDVDYEWAMRTQEAVFEYLLPLRDSGLVTIALSIKGIHPRFCIIWKKKRLIFVGMPSTSRRRLCYGSSQGLLWVIAVSPMGVRQILRRVIADIGMRSGKLSHQR